MTIGMRVWDANGELIFSETDFTMRVLGIVKIRLGSRSGRVSVPTPLAQPGVHAMVNPVAGMYSGWNTPRGVRASLPSVAVGNGELILNGPARSYYNATVDVVMVGSA